MGLLTPQPFRGDQIAAGVVALTVLVGLVLERVQEDVGGGVRLAVALAAWAFVTVLGWRSPTEPSSPRGYQVALYVCSWVLLAVALLEVVDLLDVALLDDDGAGTALWTTAALSAWAGAWSRGRRSATMTLLSALSAVLAVLAGAEWLGDPGAGTNRWLLFGSSVVLGLWALARRDRRPADAAQLANAAGLAIVAMYAFAVAGGLLTGTSGFAPLGTGWELVGAAVGFGLVGYGAIDQHRGPVAVGIVLLALWVAVVGQDGDLLGWPLVLAIGAAFLLVVGLRPTTPMPPPPEPAELPEEPLPLSWGRRR